MITQARGGYFYFITFTNDLSRFGYMYLMKHKSEAFDKFKVLDSGDTVEYKFQKNLHVFNY